MRFYFLKALQYLLDGPFAQKILFKVHSALGYLMGIAAGYNFHTSGEKNLLNKILQTVTDNAVIIDGGANIGDFAIFISQNTPTSCRTFCFEPWPTVFRTLKKNVFTHPDIFPFDLALSDTIGKQFIFSDNKGSTLSSFHQPTSMRLGMQLNEKSLVETTTLDEFCREHKLDSVFIYKLDIEGHELSALKGSAGLLSKKAIKHIVFEFGESNLDSRTTIKDFWELFYEYGYQLFRVTPNGTPIPFSSYDERLEQYRVTIWYATLK